MENMDKDVNICYNIAKEEGFHMPAMEVVKGILDEGVRRGWGKQDFRQTYRIVRGDE
jgi:3-hydroxyisobutyrate dehydrogenase